MVQVAQYSHHIQCCLSTLPRSAGYGREAAAALLLQLGADPSAAGDRSGMAALHRASARNHAATLSVLLAAGADCWQRSAAGQTPLHYASQFGHEPAVRLLLAHLAAAESGAGGGGAGSGTERTVRVHLALCDAAGLSALHLAAQWGMAGVAQLLLEAGAGAAGWLAGKCGWLDGDAERPRAAVYCAET